MYPPLQCKCLKCGEFYLPDARNRGRQKYCRKPACQGESKRESQRRWSAKPQNLASALGYAACQAGHPVLFTTAVDAINHLVAAQAAHKLKAEMAKYVSPSVLVLDELGYIPMDKIGADLLFQIISQRYERGSIILTTNKAYKQWASIFNNDAGITSAILDRLLHQAETVIIEGKSYRMKDQVVDPPI